MDVCVEDCRLYVRGLISRLFEMLGEQPVNYRSHLRSESWRRKRPAVLETAEGRRQVCNPHPACRSAR
jgi:hypothetical protein